MEPTLIFGEQRRLQKVFYLLQTPAGGVQSNMNGGIPSLRAAPRVVVIQTGQQVCVTKRISPVTLTQWILSTQWFSVTRTHPLWNVLLNCLSNSTLLWCYIYIYINYHVDVIILTLLNVYVTCFRNKYGTVIPKIFYAFHLIDIGLLNSVFIPLKQKSVQKNMDNFQNEIQYQKATMTLKLGVVCFYVRE